MPKVAKELASIQVENLTQPGRWAVGGVGCEGLALTVTPDGRRNWTLRYSVDGRRREMGLGMYNRAGSVSLAEARAAARKQRAQLADGKDPIQVRTASRAALREEAEALRAEQQRQATTLAAAARDYHERVIDQTRTTKHAAQWLASLENHMPPHLWTKPIDEVEPPELLKALVKARPHKDARNLTKDHKIAETVSRLRQRLDAIFEDAMFHGKCRTNPAAAIKRKLREEGPKKKAGNFAALDYAGAPALVERIRAADGVSARCLEFAVLTAARTTEALEAEWSEIDLRTRTWTIPAERMKADEPHVVYLSDRAVEILKAQKGSDECLVFPTSQSSRKGKPMSNMALLAVLERLGVRHLTTVHGLCRATFSTWANETAAARREVIEACLAHREADQVAAAYNRAQFNAERKALLAAWSTFLSPDGEAAEHATVAHLVAP